MLNKLRIAYLIILGTGIYAFIYDTFHKTRTRQQLGPPLSSSNHLNQYIIISLAKLLTQNLICCNNFMQALENTYNANFTFVLMHDGKLLDASHCVV